MTKFEYADVDMDSLDPQERMDEMNSLGQEGWEVYMIDGSIARFKRIIPETTPTEFTEKRHYP